MAITKNHANSGGKNHGSLARMVSYVTKEEVQLKDADGNVVLGEDGQPIVVPNCILTEGVNCSDDRQAALLQMQTTKDIFRKNDGREALHFSNSFAHDDNITPEKAMALTKELFEKHYPGHEMVLACHAARDELLNADGTVNKPAKGVHVHVIINSVNMENGIKAQYVGKGRPKGIVNRLDIKDDMNRICEREGLSQDIKRERQEFDGQSLDIDTNYKSIKRQFENGVGKWVEPFLALNNAMAKCEGRGFTALRDELKENGYELKYTKDLKHITIRKETDPLGKGVRVDSIAQTCKDSRLLKSNLELVRKPPERALTPYEIERNASFEKLQNIQQKFERAEKIYQTMPSELSKMDFQNALKVRTEFVKEVTEKYFPELKKSAPTTKAPSKEAPTRSQTQAPRSTPSQGGNDLYKGVANLLADLNKDRSVGGGGMSARSQGDDIEDIAEDIAYQQGITIDEAKSKMGIER